MFRLFAFLAVFLLSLSGVAQAVALNPQQQVLMEKIKTYLNGMKTLQGGFAQISSTGEYADGKVYMQRPGKMRLIYNPPAQTEMIVRNDTIIYHDKEFKQVTYYPLAATPLAVLLKDQISFEQDVDIVDLSKGRGVIELTMVDKEDPGMGSVTLVFSDAPLALRKWAVVDAQGVMTQISLLNPVSGQKVDPKYFEFIDPGYGRVDQ